MEVENHVLSFTINQFDQMLQWKVAQKVATAVFTPKVTKYLGNFCKKNCHRQEL